ncbi:MAG: ATP-binding protein, partial [Lachnospiraceae bacterium]|nr:ATP-binding protein [Lachnospiraceae bacterium]
IIEGSVKRAHLALEGKEDALDDLKSTNDALIAEEKRILEEAGFGADYLEMRYVCADCKDTGYIGGRRCHCFENELSKLFYSDERLRKITAKENFETFDKELYSADECDRDRKRGVTPRENIEQALADAREFIRSVDGKSENLYIYGVTGVGKSFLTHCIAKEVADSGHDVLYFPAYSLFELIISSKMKNREETGEKSFEAEQVYSSDLLIIDDLGTESMNSRTMSELYAIINERLINGKATVISTNIAPGQVSAVYDERIFSRIVQNYKVIEILGKDNRVQQKKKQL